MDNVWQTDPIPNRTNNQIMQKQSSGKRHQTPAPADTSLHNQIYKPKKKMKYRLDLKETQNLNNNALALLNSN